MLLVEVVGARNLPINIFTLLFDFCIYPSIDLLAILLEFSMPKSSLVTYKLSLVLYKLLQFLSISRTA